MSDWPTNVFFSFAGGATRSSFHSKHDWEELLDGRVNTWRPGLDFCCDVKTLRQRVFWKAKCHNRSVRFAVGPDPHGTGTICVFQGGHGVMRAAVTPHRLHRLLEWISQQGSVTHTAVCRKFGLTVPIAQSVIASLVDRDLLFELDGTNTRSPRFGLAVPVPSISECRTIL